MGPIWTRGLANKWGRLLPNGVRKQCPDNEKVKGTGTIFFINKKDIPPNQKISYGNFICYIHLHKSEIYRGRFTVDGDKHKAYEETRTPTIGLIDRKGHLNRVIFDAHKGAQHLSIDIENFYLGTPMRTDRYQYIRVHCSDVPQ